MLHNFVKRFICVCFYFFQQKKQINTQKKSAYKLSRRFCFARVIEITLAIATIWRRLVRRNNYFFAKFFNFAISKNFHERNPCLANTSDWKFITRFAFCERFLRPIGTAHFQFFKIESAVHFRAIIFARKY